MNSTYWNAAYRQARRIRQAQTPADRTNQIQILCTLLKLALERK